MFKIRRTTLPFGLPERIFLVCLTPLLVLGAYWLSGGRLPLPGTASVVIGFTAAALSFYTGIKQWQKSVAIGVLALLLWVEFRAINADRAKTDAKALIDKKDSDITAAQYRSEQNKEFARVLAAQEQDFLKTEERLRDLIRNDQRHFDSTTRRVNGVLESTQEIAGTSQRNLDALLGTDSVPCVTPRSEGPKFGPIVLRISVIGKNNLTGVNVQIWRFESFMSFRELNESVGAVSPGAPVLLSHTLTPVFNNHRPVMYHMTVSTQNGQYEESLQVSDVDGRHHYEWSAAKIASDSLSDHLDTLTRLLDTCKQLDTGF